MLSEILALLGLQGLSVRATMARLLHLIMMFTSALMTWKAMAWVLNAESPIVVVLSESMEPAFQRGDLLFLSLFPTPILAGDVCVFKLEDRITPIVHRVISVHHNKRTGEEFVLTKGDNNKVDDRGLYGKRFITRKNIIGRVNGYTLHLPLSLLRMVPYIGMITIAINDWDSAKATRIVSVEDE